MPGPKNEAESRSQEEGILCRPNYLSYSLWSLFFFFSYKRLVKVYLNVSILLQLQYEE